MPEVRPLARMTEGFTPVQAGTHLSPATAIEAPGPLQPQEWGRGVLKRLRKNKHVRRLIVAGFRAMQRAGVSVVPRHFYWPIPDLNELSERVWPIASELPGIDLQIGRQLKFLRAVAADYAEEYREFPSHPIAPAYAYHHNNGLFECVDAEIAYCMIRHLRPRRIIEVGSGFSTRVLTAALRRNKTTDAARGQMVCVEPHPDAVLREGIPGVANLIQSPVQKLPPSFVDELEAGDVLFIDSSHIAGVGSDVTYEILELLPRLRPGVVIHFHDVFLPADYPRALVMEHLSFWSEQYMVQAFLAFNTRFEILWAGSAMHFMHEEELEKAFPAWKSSYCRMPDEIRNFVPTSDQQRVWPSSLWIRKTA